MSVSGRLRVSLVLFQLLNWEDDTYDALVFLVFSIIYVSVCVWGEFILVLLEQRLNPVIS